MTLRRVHNHHWFLMPSEGLVGELKDKGFFVIDSLLRRVLMRYSLLLLSSDF